MLISKFLCLLKLILMVRLDFLMFFTYICLLGVRALWRSPARFVPAKDTLSWRIRRKLKSPAVLGSAARRSLPIPLTASRLPILELFAFNICLILFCDSCFFGSCTCCLLFALLVWLVVLYLRLLLLPFDVVDFFFRCCHCIRCVVDRCRCCCHRCLL